MNHPPSVHLSVVATSRNDDHGGELLHRMQHFVDGLVEQSRRHRLQTELILVEWNPPAGRPPLAKALRWPTHGRDCAIRIITVPPDVHARLKHGDQLPLFQMIAKNVGIRRARGQYVLATNIDILFSDSMMRYLRDDLAPGRLYRADRCDVPTAVPGGVSFEQVLAFCHREMFRINTIGHTLIKTGGHWRRPGPPWRSRLGSLARREAARLGRGLRGALPPLGRAAARVAGVGRSVARCLAQTIEPIRVRVARAGPALMRRWRRARRAGFRKSLAGLRLRAGRAAVAAARGGPLTLAWAVRSLGHGLERQARGSASRAAAAAHATGRALIESALTIGRWVRAAVRRLRALPVRASRTVKAIVHRDGLFTNACGDFTLLSRDDWFRLRGYPEWEVFSWHLDSVLLYQANRNGIREVYAGRARKIFHIEHGRGSGYTPEGVEELFTRLDAKGIPYLTWPDFLMLVAEMDAIRKDGRPVLYNADSWGLAGDELPEALIVPASRSAG